MRAADHLDGAVQVWNLTNCKLRANLQGHTGYINTVTVSPDGSLCASGGKVIPLLPAIQSNPLLLPIPRNGERGAERSCQDSLHRGAWRVSGWLLRPPCEAVAARRALNGGQRAALAALGSSHSSQ